MLKIKPAVIFVLFYCFVFTTPTFSQILISESDKVLQNNNEKERQSEEKADDDCDD